MYFTLAIIAVWAAWFLFPSDHYWRRFVRVGCLCWLWVEFAIVVT